MKCILSLFLLLVVSCAHKIERKSAIRFDPKLLIPFELAKSDSATAKSPALYEFRKDGKKLFYLAASHGTDPASDTFKFIDSIFSKKEINIVIVEGFETALGYSPVSILKSTMAGRSDKFYPHGEPSFVIEKATEQNVPFIGGEPSDREIYKAIVGKGFSEKDLIGFNFVRRIPQLNRIKKIKDMHDLRKEFEEYSAQKAKDFGMSQLNFSFEDFKDWYLEKQNRGLSINAGDKGETAPIEGPFFTQKISKVITNIRDEHILKVISDSLNEYDNVLIVYGSSHYRISHSALKASLGEPKEITLSGMQNSMLRD